MRFLFALFSLVAIVLPFTLMAAETPKTLKLYSSSKEHLIRPILQAFEAETGIQVKATTLGGAAMVTRLALEGEDTPADAVIVADVAHLHKLDAKGLLSGFQSKVVEETIPSILRAPDNAWVGVAMRARLIFKRKDDDVQISTYDALADEKWRGQVLVRSSDNPYNQSLLSDVIARKSRAEALVWAKGVVANMARPPQGGDRDQLRALASGSGRFAIANSYYYAQMLTGEDEKDKLYAEWLQPIFPENTHVNIRGAGITKASQNKALAQQLMEFLVSEKAQALFTSINQEYPANPKVVPSATLKAFGPVPQPVTPLTVVGEGNATALEVFAEAGWQ